MAFARMSFGWNIKEGKLLIVRTQRLERLKIKRVNDSQLLERRINFLILRLEFDSVKIRNIRHGFLIDHTSLLG